MSTFNHINHCPGTLKQGFQSYSKTCLNRVFNGKKVHHVLNFNSPNSEDSNHSVFLENHQRISISGVQEKFSVVLEKNRVRLSKTEEQGSHILKTIPSFGKNASFMPANEHLTMQIARQIYGIETAENALIFFKGGEPAYITKRFDIAEDGHKWAQDDFASLAGKTPQRHGENYKYSGNYLELFIQLKKYLPIYQIEAPKLFKLIIFNYLFSNGDAHYKNFSIHETPLGDFRLSPAYDLLNTRIHMEDSDFALEGGLLGPRLSQGSISNQFKILANQAEVNPKQTTKVMEEMRYHKEKVELLINSSFLSEKLKRNYLQSYHKRLKLFCK